METGAIMVDCDREVYGSGLMKEPTSTVYMSFEVELFQRKVSYEAFAASPVPLDYPIISMRSKRSRIRDR